MSRQSQTPDHKSDQDRTSKQIVTHSDQGLEPNIMIMPTLSSVTDNVRDQANALNNPRLSPPQRQTMARRIGQIGGNEYLQRVMVQMKQDEFPAKSQARQKQAPLIQRIGPMRVAENTLSNGRRQRTTRIAFTQVIARSEADSSEMESGEMEQQEPIFIGKIGPPQETEVSSRDSVSASATHVPSVNSGRAVDPGNFGTTGASIGWDNVIITPGSGTYTVTADLIHDIDWGVLSGTGPNGQVDVADENDSDILACNYQLAASDLTPNMGSDNGRPPRTEFWAEDLTERHELFHAVNQRELSFGPSVTTAMQNWLNAQTTTSTSHLENTLLPQAITEGLRVYNALVALPSTEGDAYGDGAPLYQARADAIKTKGDVGDYGLISTEVTILPKGGEEYEIVEGDTLWDIAERTYGHGRYWRDIHRANPGKARDGGNLIFPGQTFDLPSIVMEQDLSVSLSLDSKIYISETVTVNGSHIFFVLPSDVFSDATNCSGDVTIELWDADGNSLLTAVWSLPGSVNSGDSNYEVAANIVS